MSQQLALDLTNNDLILNPDGGVERVDEGRFVVQNVRSKLRTQLGEFLLNPYIGWINLEDFVKQYDLFDIEDRAREIILGTEGVSHIETIDLVVNQRVLTLTFQASTIYGMIDLTVPWSSI